MRKALVTGLLIVAAAAVAGAAAGQDRAKTAAGIQPVSWDAWLAAKTAAEARDVAGDLVGALQYYLEYIRQAEGLNSPARAAWGKNNAAYMVIKMHRLDRTVDLAPAKKMLEEGLALAGATEDCRKIMAFNLESVKAALAPSR
jgi:hypothetical protein